MTAVVLLRWRDKARFKGGGRGIWWGPGLTSLNDVKQDRVESSQEPCSSARRPTQSQPLFSICQRDTLEIYSSHEIRFYVDVMLVSIVDVAANAPLKNSTPFQILRLLRCTKLLSENRSEF